MKFLLITAMGLLMSYSLFTQGFEDEEEMPIDNKPKINDYDYDLSNKLKEMSCQTCRKLKRHKEVLPMVWECTKCKRRTDLN